MKRVAFDGAASDSAVRAACDTVRTRYGAFIALVRKGSRCAALVARYAPIATYRADEPRDAAIMVVLDNEAFKVEVWAETPAEEPMPKHEFIWLDLETTGLDPARGALLEFAAVLCEDARGDDFAVVQSFSGVVHHDVAALACVPIDVAVTRMHTANGLWHDVAASTTTLAEVDAFLAELAASLTGGRKRAASLAGSSVAFDLAWSLVHLPRFAEYLSHRVFDVSTLRRAVDAWATTPVVWPARDAHRALDDIMATIDEARVARRAMFAAVPL